MIKIKKKKKRKTKKIDFKLKDWTANQPNRREKILKYLFIYLFFPHKFLVAD